jgi:hypothetical protein
MGLQSVVGHKNKTQIVSLARVVRINWVKLEICEEMLLNYTYFKIMRDYVCY